MLGNTNIGEKATIVNGIIGQSRQVRPIDPIFFEAILFLGDYGRNMPILSTSVNQRVWSGAIAIASGSLFSVGTR